MINENISAPPALDRKGRWQAHYDRIEMEFLRAYAPGTTPLNNWTVETLNSTSDVVCFIRAAYLYFKRKGYALKTAKRKAEPLKVWCQLSYVKPRTGQGEKS